LTHPPVSRGHLSIFTSPLHPIIQSPLSPTQIFIIQWHRLLLPPAQQRSTPSSKKLLPTPQRSSPALPFTPDSPWLVQSAVQSPTGVSHLLMCMLAIPYLFARSQRLLGPTCVLGAITEYLANMASITASRQEYNSTQSHIIRVSLEDSDK
jgi:hypothetical protein